MKRVSVVVVNFNYERFVGIAIESALALDWDDVEVVVVDDGSTDGSSAIIQAYADRCKVLLTENATQRVAANRGFARTTGDVVIFLDSDDVLPPELPRRLAQSWTPNVSKAQFRMQRIDERGEPRGAPFPAYRRVPSPADIKYWVESTSAYPTPPGSGNAYSRWFLDRIFPVGPDVGDAADSACLAAAPFCGDVVTVPEVVVRYRRHGVNDSNLLADDGRFAREVRRARARWRFALRAAGGVDGADDAALFRSRELLQLRIASYRVAPSEQSLPGDRMATLMRDVARAPVQPGPENLGERLLITLWCGAVLVTPLRVARRLLTFRYGRGG